MSVDVVIHIFENDLTEEDLSMFFSNCLGSKHFNLDKHNYEESDKVSRKVEKTDQYLLWEVSDSAPDWIQTIVDDIIGEDLPEVTDDLISRIKEFYDYPGLLQWLTKNKNKRIFVVYW